MPQKIMIISGGQTGVDRAALDAALETGIPAGGWCPEGRKAEDGRISDGYPLWELPGGDYLQRTHRNVADSDATLIICFGKLQGGTERTLHFCRELGKPYLLVDGSSTTTADAAVLIRDFLVAKRVYRLNVAGPRASGEPKAYAYTFAALRILLTSMK